MESRPSLAPTSPAASGSVVQQSSIAGAFGWESTQLDAVKSMYFPEQDETTPCAANTFCNGGSELSYTVTGWGRNAEAGLVFFTSRGDTIKITSAGGITVKDAAGALMLQVTAVVEAGRRRLGFFSALQTSGSFTMMQAGRLLIEQLGCAAIAMHGLNLAGGRAGVWVGGAGVCGGGGGTEAIANAKRACHISSPR